MFQGCHLLQTVKTEIISPYMHMFITSQHRGLEINHLLFGSGLRFLPIFLGCFPSGQRATQSNNNPRVEQTLPPSVCQPPRIITTSSVSAEPSTASLSISPARSLSLSLIWVIHEIFIAALHHIRHSDINFRNAQGGSSASDNLHKSMSL